MNTKKSIVFFTKYTSDAPASFHHSYVQKASLEADGFSCRFYSLYSSASSKHLYKTGKKASAVTSFFASVKRLLQLLFMKSNDIAVIEYPLLPGMSFSLQKWLLRKQKHLVTDLIYASFEKKNRNEDWKSFLSFSKAVVTPNAILTKQVFTIADEVKEIPICVSLKEYNTIIATKRTEEEKNIFYIGWIGTKATNHHLLMIKDCLLQLHDLYHIKLVLVGFDKTREKDLQNLPFTNYERNASTEISLLKTCDAAVLPLPDEPLSVNTSTFPMIQYMACALPVVASSNEVTIAINHGNENLFARTTFEWYSCLAAMIQNKAFYKQTGNKNKVIVNEFYPVEKTQQDYLSLFQHIIDD